jgi:hypothetical protein
MYPRSWWKPAAEDVARDGARLERAFRSYFHRDVAPPDEPAPAPAEASFHSGDWTASSSSSDDAASPASSSAACGAACVARAAAAPAPDAGGAAPCAPASASEQQQQQQRPRAEILVCHGNVIRFFALRALQLPPEAWLRLVVAHASITTISITAEGDVLLSGLGEAGHLDAEQVTCS